MKHIIKNDLGITKEELTSEVTRIKVLLINSNNEILLGYSRNCYQFIGGHIEQGEDLIKCLNREVLEEVGIDLNVTNIEPFFLLEHYCNDHPVTTENINCKNYYYVIYTDLKPNIEKTNRTKEELDNDFRFEYVKLDNLVNIITTNYNKYKDAKIVGDEMILAYNIYKSTCKKRESMI